MTNIVAIIPARMGSSRFPGKPMASILGMPMIGHVYERVRRCRSLSATHIATCDREIFDYITSIGGQAVMTSDAHERASDRCAEALRTVEQRTGAHADIVVMVQGDEPMTHPDMIDEAIAPMLADPGILITNLAAPVATEQERIDRNCIKVVMDGAGNALYFSREPIPTTCKIGARAGAHKQICVIPFRRDFLLRYNALAPTPLEVAESVDMLRVLEHGLQVRMVPTRFDTHAVDTPADLVAVEEAMRADPYTATYLGSVVVR